MAIYDVSFYSKAKLVISFCYYTSYMKMYPIIIYTMFMVPYLRPSSYFDDCYLCGLLRSFSIHSIGRLILFKYHFLVPTLK
ncbi:hypothetical protein AtNW77_Chr5g0141921 [Arabidopsis thaliana]